MSLPDQRAHALRNVHGELLAGCDCCGAVRVCRPANHPSIETSACAVCRGGELCPSCLDDRAYCECLPAVSAAELDLARGIIARARAALGRDLGGGSVRDLLLDNMCGPSSRIDEILRQVQP